MRRRIALLVLVVTLPIAAAVPGRASTVDLTVSNFRFCSGQQCLPFDFVYVRNPTGNGLINQNALAATIVFRKIVHAGDTVTWTYRDSLCDGIAQCPGHAVCFENLTQQGDCGTRTLDARSGPVSVSWTVPASAQPGTLYRYFCNVNEHYLFGMTGALLVK